MNRKQSRKYFKRVLIAVLVPAGAAFVLISMPLSAIPETLRYALIAVIAGAALSFGLTHLLMYIFAAKERYLLIHSALCLPVFISTAILFVLGITVNAGTSPALLQAMSVITLIMAVFTNVLCVWFSHEILGLPLKDTVTRAIYGAALALPPVMILITGMQYAAVWSVLFGVPYIIIAVQTLSDKRNRENPYIVAYICVLSLYAIMPIITLLPFARALFAPQAPVLLLALLMQAALISYGYGILKRREKIIVADRERANAERDITVEIQKAMLPNPFFPFPGRDEVELFADVQPAEAAGGDFFDYFFIDKYTLAVIIAQGSKSGVHAALFMSLAKTLLKSSARRGMSPGEIFESVNNLLCEDNREQIGITAFLGLLHVPRGRFTYANAGHFPPLVSRGEAVVKMSESTDGALALSKNKRYTQGELMLQAGDGMFLYTSGVFGAENSEGEPYGEYRMIETAGRYMASGASPMELIQSMKQEIDGFAGETPHRGDITMLSLRIVK